MIGVRIGRRGAIVAMATAATGAAAAAAGVGIAARPDRLPATMRAVLERMIGPFTMHDSEFARFAADFAANRPVPRGIEAGALGLSETLGTTGTLARLNRPLAERVEGFERTLLADFALATGIEGPPGDRPLTYSGLFGAGGCGNPFARFA